MTVDALRIRYDKTDPDHYATDHGGWLWDDRENDRLFLFTYTLGEYDLSEDGKHAVFYYNAYLERRDEPGEITNLITILTYLRDKRREELT